MDEYKTKDIFEAAWLYSQDIPLVKLEPDGRYSWFIFKGFSRSEGLSSRYWARTATGNIKKYVDSLKSMKDLVFSKNMGSDANRTTYPNIRKSWV